MHSLSSFRVLLSDSGKPTPRQIAEDFHGADGRSGALEQLCPKRRCIRGRQSGCDTRHSHEGSLLWRLSYCPTGANALFDCSCVWDNSISHRHVQWTFVLHALRGSGALDPDLSHAVEVVRIYQEPSEVSVSAPFLLGAYTW